MATHILTGGKQHSFLYKGWGHIYSRITARIGPLELVLSCLRLYEDVRDQHANSPHRDPAELPQY